MSRIRLILLSVFAVFAVSAVSSASASAACSSEAPHEAQLCIAGAEPAPGSYPITVELAASELVVAGLGTVKCTGGESIKSGSEEPTAVFEVGADSVPVEVSDLALKFTGCTITVAGQPTCAVKEGKVEVGLADGLDGTFNAAATKVTIAPSDNGTVFGTLVVEKCGVLSKNYNITGKQTCELPGHATELAEHTVECLAAGSSLKVAGKTATYEGNATVELANESDQLFSLIEG